MEDKYCPCCGRHCPLSAPSCERGIAYVRSGGEQGAERGEHEHDHCEHSHGHGHGEHCRGGHGHGRFGGGRGDLRAEEYGALGTDEKLMFNLRAIGHVLYHMTDERASQNRILIILNELGAITQSELTERLGIKSGSASEVIGKLERAGLIVRSENENDKRTSEVRLTDEGKDRATCELEKRSQSGDMFSCLSDEEKQTVLLLLEKLNTDWRTRAELRGHGQGHGHGERGHWHGEGRGRGGRRGRYDHGDTEE